MNVLSAIFKFLCAISILVAINSAKCDTNAPISTWEQHPEIAKLLLTLKDHSIHVQITNASSTPKVLIRLENDDIAMLFYVDDHGALIPLGYRLSYTNPRSDGGPIWTYLSPLGESTSIDISSEELTQVKAHPVVCYVLVRDPSTKKMFKIESEPIKL